MRLYIPELFVMLFVTVFSSWGTPANSVSSLEQGIFIKEVHFSSKRYVYGKKSRSVGGLQEPNSLCIGSDESLYVSDKKRSMILKFNKDGLLESEVSPGQALVNPNSMAFDGQNLFVLDRSLHHILVLDKSESLVKILGKKGSEKGSFLYPQDILYSRGRQSLIVADTGNLRIQEIDGEGKFIQAFVYAKSALEVGAPTSLARIGKYLYALYPDYNEIVRFHRNSASIDKVFKLPEVSDTLKRPVQIQGFHDEVLLLRDGSDSIYFLNPDGVVMDRFEVKKELFSVFSKIGSFLMDIRGNLWVIDERESRIWKFPSNSSFQTLLNAQEMIEEGESDKAIEEIEKLLQRDPQSKKALELYEAQLELRISEALKSQDYESAYNDLQSLLKVFPSNRLALTRLRVLTWKKHRETLWNLCLALVCLILFWLLALHIYERSQEDTPQ